MGVRVCSRHWLWPAVISVCLLCTGAVRVEQRTWLVLHVDTLLIDQQGTEVLASETLKLDGEEAGFELKRISWPPFPETGRLHLTASGHPAISGEFHPVQIETRFELKGRSFSGRREFAMRAGSSYLMEAFAHEGQRLLTALRIETASGPVVIGPRKVSQRIGFELEIARVNDSRAIPLETNQLNTFVGESVEYSFRRGAGDQLESLLLRLRPVRIDDDLAEVEFELIGSLPGEPTRLVLDRRESLYTSRNATSSIEVTAGVPPVGYRFRVTPRF